MAHILDGKKVAATYKERLDTIVQQAKELHLPTTLAIILVGDDPASHVYAKRLEKLGASIGIEVLVHRMPAVSTQQQVMNVVYSLNKDAAISGILPMMPLPRHLDSDLIGQAIYPNKDVDSIHPHNIGMVAIGKSIWAPSTSRAVMAILDYYDIPIAGRRAVVIGRSNVVGRPLLQLLLNKHATVTVCHSRTQDLASIVRQGEIVIAAVGQPGLITSQMITPGTVVVDVGVNQIGDSLVGDVAFDEVEPLASAITPVPGGVGAVSTIMVMNSLLRHVGEHTRVDDISKTKQRIEVLRNQLHQAFSEKGSFEDQKVIELSAKLDDAILEYQQVKMQMF